MERALHIIQVVPRLHEESSGPSHTVPALCEALADTGAQVELHTNRTRAGLRPHGYALQVSPAWRGLERLGFSPPLLAALREACRQADVIHNHSLWMLPNVYPAWAARRGSCRLVTSPRGTLSAWSLAHSRWRKRVMWWLCQGRAVRDSHCFHATSEGELREIRRLGLDAPVTIIPNGVEIPERIERPARSPASRRRLLFLGRLHPKKGVDELLKAWRRIQDEAQDWELEIVGPGETGYLAKLRQLAGGLGVRRLRFAGSLHGAAKAAAFAQADLFVLPTHSENFGLAVAEALAHGVPAVVSRAAPWQGLETRECGWWIDEGEGPLAECLAGALGLAPGELAAKGERGRRWMKEEFSWQRAGRMMRETYEWLLGGGSRPAWVEISR